MERTKHRIKNTNCDMWQSSRGEYEFRSSSHPNHHKQTKNMIRRVFLMTLYEWENIYVYIIIAECAYANMVICCHLHIRTGCARATAVAIESRIFIFFTPFCMYVEKWQQNGGVFHCVNWTCSSLYCKKESISIKRKHYPK